MRDLLLTLSLLACPVGMGLMVWMMTRTGRTSTHSNTSDPEARARELAQLRADVESLREDEAARGGPAADPHRAAPAERNHLS